MTKRTKKKKLSSAPLDESDEDVFGDEEEDELTVAEDFLPGDQKLATEKTVTLDLVPGKLRKFITKKD